MVGPHAVTTFPSRMPFVSRLPDGRVLLAVHVQPRASRTGLVCLHDRAVKLALTSPPVEDAANRALVAFFSSFFRVPRQRVILHRGQQSRHKQVILDGLSEEVVRRRILEEIAGQNNAPKRTSDKQTNRGGEDDQICDR